MTATKTSPAQLAADFAARCLALGWTWSVRGNVVEISTTFAPGDSAAYSKADGEASGLLSLAPLKGGSVWGTDGGSVGGYVGLKNGYYRLNKSGTGARFLAALAKIGG